VNIYYSTGRPLRDILEACQAYRERRSASGVRDRRRRFPALSLDYVREHTLRIPSGYLSGGLARAAGRVSKITADICSRDLSISPTFDLVFFQMLAEHVLDSGGVSRQCVCLAEPGGIALQFFPRCMPRRLRSTVCCRIDWPAIVSALCLRRMPGTHSDFVRIIAGVGGRRPGNFLIFRVTL